MSWPTADYMYVFAPFAVIKLIRLMLCEKWIEFPQMHLLPHLSFSDNNVMEFNKFTPSDDSSTMQIPQVWQKLLARCVV